MTMTVRYKGIEYKNLISGQVNRSIGSICGEFMFQTSAKEDQTIPIKTGDAIQIIIDGNPVISGYVDIIQGNYSANSHIISVTGRDRTSDLVDSCVKGKHTFNAGISLPSIIQSVISGLGITDISVKNQAGSIASFVDSSSAEIGETAFSFLEKLSRKIPVLLTTDGLGNIVITRGIQTASNLKLVNLMKDSKKVNNIKESSFRSTSDDRFNSYQTHGQKNPLFGISEDSPENMTGIIGVAVDSEIRASRFLSFFAEESLTSAESKQRATWEANLRRAKSFQYSAVVQGHSLNGTLWTFNQLVNVIDEFWDISADLLISDVSYFYSLDQGSTTELTLTYPDAFTLEANLNQIKSRTQKLAGKFTI